MGPVQDPVQYGIRHRRVGGEAVPLRHWDLTGQDRCRPFIAVLEHFPEVAGLPRR